LGDGKEERGKRIRTLLAFLEVGDTGLEFEDVSAEEVGGAGAVCTGLRKCALRCGLHVETGCEGAVAGTGEDYGADGGVVGELAEDGGEVMPHSMGDVSWYIGMVALCDGRYVLEGCRLWLVQYDALAFSYSRSREVSMIMRIVTAIEERFQCCLPIHVFAKHVKCLGELLPSCGFENMGYRRELTLL